MYDVTKYGHQLLEQAFQMEATDLHIDPYEHVAYVQTRVAGTIHRLQHMPLDRSQRLIAHYKFLAGMDIGERRLPQSGSYMTSLFEKDVHLRFSALPTSFGESIAIRFLPKYDVMPLEDLMLFPKQAADLKKLVMSTSGLIVVTGPTGSGKTTTLYGMLKEILNVSKKHIVTLEDPVEKTIQHLVQIQMNEKAGMTFASGLRGILRHDPDVIMIGEIRDQETAKIAISAALTGHLVITTMHTKNAFGVLHRFIDFGVSFADLKQALVAAIAQRLVKVGDKAQLAVYEILEEKELYLAIDALQNQVPYHLSFSIDDQLKKAYALGFVKKEDIYDWVMPNNEERKLVTERS